MRHASDHLIALDGVRLATRAWLPRADPLATVVLVHGFGEHVARHERLATDLARSAYAVYGYDQRGHGYSGGDRANVRRFDDLLDDLQAFVDELRHTTAGAPLVVFGHSTGGSLALRGVQEGRIAPDALVLSAPLLRFVGAPPRPVVAVLRALSRPFPRLPTLTLDPKHISRDPLEVDAYRLDPAIYHGPTKARIGALMLEHGAIALERAPAVGTPALLLHGTNDRIADVDATRHLERLLPEATLRLYHDGPHELFHDAHRERATADVLAWLQARLSPDATPAAART
ncbi:alpha/beta hydrolase [soil metagenome]